jgi:adenylate cyclase
MWTVNGPHEPGAWLEDNEGRRFPIQGTCAIGRGPGTQLVLADDLASRRHALVHAQEHHQYWLVDLGSRNGTVLDGRRINRPTLLRDGSRIKIGGAVFTFHQTAPASEGAAHVADGGTITQIKATACWLLVADIVGSTRLEQQIPPEELPVMTGRWLAECTQLVEQGEGGINKYLGDGFLAYWNDEEAAPQRIAGVAQALVELQARSPLSFRFALHFGRVLVGGASLGEDNLSGREVNFIFRMEKLASALGVARLLSEPACQQLAGHLSTAPIGLHPLHGFEGQFPFFTF